MLKQWEIDGFLKDVNGTLHIGGSSAKELTAEHGSPVFVYSSKRIRDNINRILKIQNVIDCKLKVCYAAKAISEPAILEFVRESGIDIEVNSGGELSMALEAGFMGSQIIFNGNSKSEKELSEAIDADIYAIQSDSFYELELTAEIARKLGKRANVSLRLVPNIQSETLHGLQTALLTSKFGMMPEEALKAFEKWPPNDPHMNLCGIHIHIGSQNPSPEPYRKALVSLFKYLKEISDRTEHKIGHINIGGGFPVNYLRDDSHAQFMSRDQVELLGIQLEPEDIIGGAWQAMKHAAEKAGAVHLVEDIELLVEPGRSVVGDAAVCLTTVRNRKERPREGAVSSFNVQRSKSEMSNFESKELSANAAKTNIEPGTLNLEPPSDVWLLTDAGFNILLSMETYKWYYHLIHATRLSEPHESPYKVAGPLCDGGDVYFDIEGDKRLPDQRLLPKDVKPGELLALLNTGAYTVSQMFPYNGRELPRVVLI